MFTTSQPLPRNHDDSARVENRGPWMTTTVPPSCTVVPAEEPAASAATRSSGQKGSAKLTWFTTSPVK